MVAMDLCFITAASTPVLCRKYSQTGVIAVNAMTRQEATLELVSL